MRRAHLPAIAICLASAAPAAAAPARPAAIAEFNREFQQVWDRLSPAILVQGTAKARAELAAIRHTTKHLEVSVKHVGRIAAGLQAAPAFVGIDDSRVELAVPGQGTWWIEAEAEFRVKVRLGFLRPTFDVPVKLRVEQIKVRQSAQIDTADPDRPSVKRIDRPDVRFRIKADSPRFVYDALFWLLRPLGERWANRAVSDALTSLRPTLDSMIGLPGPIPAAGAPALVDSGAPYPLDAIVAGVDRKTRAVNLPHGTILEAYMDAPSTDSFEVAFGPGGPGVVGNVARYHDGGDSAIWTGHYLASQAFRYAQTQDPDALDNVRHTLYGIGKLLEINGNSGLLARVAAPASSLMGQEIARIHAIDTQRTINGQLWYGRQGGNGISRDQYSGVFFGLALTHELVSDPALKAEAGRHLTRMLDYIIREQWFVDEDRRPFDATSGGSFPTFWFGIPTQRICWLLLGERVLPGRYAVDLAQASPLADIAWLSGWIGTFNLEQYYGFNLSHTTAYAYFRYETDPTRWQGIARSMRIMRRFTGHHQNAHFDLVQAAFDPSLRAAKHSEVRELIRQFVKRNHREVAPSVVDLTGVTYATYALPTLTLPGQQPKPATVTLPTAPIAVPIRKLEGNFLWQRSPFSPTSVGAGNPYKENPGIDLLVPYWMGKFEGAF